MTGEQLGLRVAGEALEGVHTRVGIAIRVFDDGDEFIRRTTAAEDDGEVLPDVVLALASLFVRVERDLAN
jgi:hypothetical protein